MMVPGVFISMLPYQLLMASLEVRGEDEVLSQCYFDTVLVSGCLQTLFKSRVVEQHHVGIEVVRSGRMSGYDTVVVRVERVAAEHLESAVEAELEKSVCNIYLEVGVYVAGLVLEVCAGKNLTDRL